MAGLGPAGLPAVDGPGTNAPVAEPAAAPAPTPASAPAAAVSAPLLYRPTRPKKLERVFGFMDSNGDGKVTRDEAAKFRNAARHFDAADINKDDFLSREEFDSAMNRSKTP